jgi:formate dehydrogenase subunit delta
MRMATEYKEFKMDMKNLVQMANKIGEFFEAMPDREEALLGIASHLKNFWEPRMRKQLLEYLDAENGKDLKPVVVTALRDHRHKILSQ